MKALFLLVSLTLTITSVVAHDPEGGESVCNTCAQLFEDGSDFMQNCGMYMDPLMLVYLRKACDKHQGDDATLAVFLDNLRAVCENKGKQTFTLPECVCDTCDLLFESDSSFMTNCGGQLDTIILDKLVLHCPQYADNEAQFGAFMENIHTLCESKNNTTPFEEPDCDCTTCGDLFDRDSDFMLECGSKLDIIILLKLRVHCRHYEDDEDQLAAFILNLHALCESKEGDFVFEDPNCDCDECALLFDGSSDFMRQCGVYMNPLMLDYQRKSCERLEADDQQFAVFVENLQTICGGAAPFSFSDPGECNAIEYQLRQWCICVGCSPERFECEPVTHQCDCINCDCAITQD